MLVASGPCMLGVQDVAAGVQPLCPDEFYQARWRQVETAQGGR